MLLLRFFQTIDNSFIGRFVDKKMDLILETDPDRIYIENIRSFYGITTPIAKTLCEMAVKENLYTKMISINCPDCGRVIKSIGHSESLPKMVTCEVCQLLEKEKYEFSFTEYYQMPFYKLNREVL